MGIKGDKAVWEAESGGLELLNLRVGDLLDQQAEALPNKEALVYNYPELGINVRWTYQQYRAEVDRVAKALLALGIERGEHVAMWSPNLPEWILVQLALARIGAVLVTVNTYYRAAEIEYVLRQGDVTTLFMVEEMRGNSYLDSIYGIAPEIKQVGDPARERLHSQALPQLKRVVLIGNTARPGLLLYSEMLKLGENISEAQLQERYQSVTPQDVAIIMYTSGTTGFPKGAMLTQHAIVNSAYLPGRGQTLDDEKTVSPWPLFHITGCVVSVLLNLVTGNTLIEMVAFDPVKQLELIQTEKATRSGAVPTMFVAMINHPRFLAGEFDLSSLRSMALGAASVPVVLMEQIQKMNLESGIAFGMTETSGVATSTLQADSFELRSTTVGIPIPHLEAKVVSLETGESVGFGEKGELLLRGCTIMQGYYNMPEKTAETIDAENWLHTGDLATMTEKGYVSIVGRVKDMIIRGGENIYPAEVEAFLMRHPKVAEAQVVGLPDPYMGEEAVALIKLKPNETATEEEIRAFCQAGISKYKIPRYIRFVTEYPLTASGKVKKFELKSKIMQDLGLKEARQPH